MEVVGGGVESGGCELFGHNDTLFVAAGGDGKTWRTTGKCGGNDRDQLACSWPALIDTLPSAMASVVCVIDMARRWDARKAVEGDETFLPRERLADGTLSKPTPHNFRIW